MTVDLLDLTGIAARLGVNVNALYQARFRHRNHEPPFPAPDVILRPSNREGWRPERLEGIRAWMASLPGQGAGGGRPRSRRAASAEREHGAADA